MMMMKHHWVEHTLAYTGEALSNHWIYKNFGHLGSAVVAFRGPCQVDLERMVDLEDVLNNDAIYSTDMLHFIIEVFGPTLQEGVLLQRLFSAIAQQKIAEHVLATTGKAPPLERRGDDVFFNQVKKLSVSICTLSPTSILIHAGFNVTSHAVPVEAAGLVSDLGLSEADVPALALSMMRTLADEWRDVQLACCKVKAVG